jgi:hypothetical protein
MGPGGDPLIVSLQFQPQRAIRYAEISIASPLDRARLDSPHLLRDYAHIGFPGAVISKAIIAKPIVKVAKQGDIALQPDIGSPAAAPATPEASASKSTTRETRATAKASTAPAERRKARRPGASMNASGVLALPGPRGGMAWAACRASRLDGGGACRACLCWPVFSFTTVGDVLWTFRWQAVARIVDCVPYVPSCADVAGAKPLAYPGVVISDAAPVRGIMPPMMSDARAVWIDRPVYIDVASTPVNASAPIIST